MSTLLERLRREIARSRADDEDTWSDAIGLTAAEAEKLLAVVEAAKVVDNSVYITPNNDKGAAEWEGMSRALAALDES